MLGMKSQKRVGRSIKFNESSSARTVLKMVAIVKLLLLLKRICRRNKRWHSELDHLKDQTWMDEKKK